MLTETPHLFWFTVGNLLLANLFILIFGLTGIRLFSKIVECPKGVLIPLILVLSVVGTYSIQNNIVDVYWMLGCGVVGFLLKMYRFQVAPIILGLILGPLMDVSFRRAALSIQNDFGALATDFATNPISLILCLAIAGLLMAQIFSRRR